MDKLSERLADLGELRLLQEVLLPDVTSDPGAEGDDCALITLPGNECLWSIDPCPRPVADMLGLCSPEVWGWYTAAINLSDIASCGGRPIAMLTSLELPEDMDVEFVRRFQSGLMSALRTFGVTLRGGNVKAAKRFAATGTILGVPGPIRVTRAVEDQDCYFYLIGQSGRFWSSIVVETFKGHGDLSGTLQSDLRMALLYPRPQVEAGRRLSELPFRVGCMDCSDGVANALQQLATVNSIDIEVAGSPPWDVSPMVTCILDRYEISVESVCYGFGDWQLACVVPVAHANTFEAQLSSFKLMRLGRSFKGSGRVHNGLGRALNPACLNENFRGGYNSVDGVDGLFSRFIRQPVFV